MLKHNVFLVHGRGGEYFLNEVEHIIDLILMKRHTPPNLVMGGILEAMAALATIQVSGDHVCDVGSLQQDVVVEQ